MNFTLHIPTLLVLCSTMLWLGACQKPADPPVPASTAVSQSAATTSASDATTLRIVDNSGATLATFNPRNLEVTTGLGDKAKTLQAKTREDGKRKYARLGEGVVMEIKPGDDGFKLRNADARLLWKIKLKDNSIKISDNEENSKPITLKIKRSHIEVSDNGKALGEVGYDGDKSRAKITDAAGQDVATVQTSKNSAAFALQLATRIPEAERAVLALELLARDL